MESWHYWKDLQGGLLLVVKCLFPLPPSPMYKDPGKPVGEAGILPPPPQPEGQAGMRGPLINI